MSGKETIRQQLSAHLDGELSGSEAERVERAVREDAELAGELAELRAVRRLVHGLPRRRVPDDFARRVLSQAERRHLVGVDVDRGPARRFRWVRHLAGAAVLLVAASVGVIAVATLWNVKTTPERIAHTGPPTGTINGRGEAGRAEAGRELLSGKGRKGVAGTPADMSGKSGGGSGAGQPAGPMAKDARIVGGRARKVADDQVTRGRGWDTSKSGPISDTLAGAKVLAAFGLTPGEGGLPAAVRNEVIFTANVPNASRQVEALLNRMDLKSLVVAKLDQPAERSGGHAGFSFYQTIRRDDSVQQILAFVTPQQMSQLATDLKEIRRQHTVARRTEYAEKLAEAGLDAVRPETETGDELNDTYKDKEMKKHELYERRAGKPAATSAPAPRRSKASDLAVRDKKTGTEVAHKPLGPVPETTTAPLQEDYTYDAKEQPLQKKHLPKDTTGAAVVTNGTAAVPSQPAIAPVAGRPRSQSGELPTTGRSIVAGDAPPTGGTLAARWPATRPTQPLTARGGQERLPKAKAVEGKTAEERCPENDGVARQAKRMGRLARRLEEQPAEALGQRAQATTQPAFQAAFRHARADVLLLITLQFRLADAAPARAALVDLGDLKRATTQKAARLKEATTQPAVRNEASQ